MSDDFRDLAESLMGHLASVRYAYATATATHPEDDARSLILGTSEAAILRARRLLYAEPSEGPKELL